MRQKTSIIITVTTAVLLAVVFFLRGKPGNYPPTLATETVPQDEAGFINQAVSLLAGQANPRKPHGCLKGHFQVISNLEPALRTALFSPGASYPAWISFWADDERKSDSEPTLQHAAIKLTEVDGEKFTGPEAEHDLFFSSHPVFPFADVETYAEALEAISQDRQTSFFFNPLRPGLQAFQIYKAMREQHRDLLAIRWWSVFPHKYGPERAVKFSLRPCVDAMTKRSNYGAGMNAGFLRERLIETTGSAPTCLEFMVQFQTDPETMPIENPAVHWDETVAPYIPIARLAIPAQSPPAEQDETCDSLAFNPWRALPAHQPLGGINRARRRIFAAFANGEPTPSTLPPVFTTTESSAD